MGSFIRQKTKRKSFNGKKRPEEGKKKRRKMKKINSGSSSKLSRCQSLFKTIDLLLKNDFLHFSVYSGYIFQLRWTNPQPTGVEFSQTFGVPKMNRIGLFLSELLKNKKVTILGPLQYTVLHCTPPYSCP